MVTKKNEKMKRIGRLGWGLRILAGLIILFLIFLLVGYLYQTKTTAGDFIQFLPPGQMVDVGGHSLHIFCAGAGNPTVVVDAGNGDFSIGWSLVQPEVATFTRICTYDRAGYGWSDPGPEPRTAQQIAIELHTLLTNAGVEGPYVLVGHSLGGYDVRIFASMYPDDVVGMVLVDAGHEDQFDRLPPEYERINQQQKSYLSVMAGMARFGILRLIGNSSGGQNFAPEFVQKLPIEQQAIYLTMMSHPSYFDATLSELNALPESTAQVRSLADLGDLPLVVLTAEKTIDAAALESIKMSGDFDFEQLQQTWLELQNELAALSTNSTHIIAEGSGHAIHLDRPVLVIDVILTIIESIR